MKTPTKDELKAAIPHLSFEFYHFQFYARLIQLQVDGCSPIVHGGLNQAVGYAFLIHLRALLDFFYSIGKDDDDLLATDFSIVTVLPMANINSGWVSDVKKQLNKRLAHITSPRWKTRPPDMDYYLQYVSDINSQISTFRNALPPELQELLKAEMDGFARRDAALLGY